MFMVNEIRLSSNEFKALASETRASIIKLLKERNHTLTEISKKLHLAAPTIKQHLGVLEGAELIHEMDEGRKWKYYSLTRKGKSIFSPETPVNVLIVLGITILALVGILSSFISVLGSQTAMLAANAVPRAPAFIGSAEKELIASAGGGAADSVATASSQVAEEGIQVLVKSVELGIPTDVLFAFLLGIVLVSVMIGFFLARLKK